MSNFDISGIDRHRSTVQTRAQNEDRRPRTVPAHVVVDETAIQIDVAVPAVRRRRLRDDPPSPRPLGSDEIPRCSPRRPPRNTARGVSSTRSSPSMARRGDRRPAAVTDFDPATTRTGSRNGVERTFREVERRTDQFSNCFGHAEANTWLRAFASAGNRLPRTPPPGRPEHISTRVARTE